MSPVAHPPADHATQRVARCRDKNGRPKKLPKLDELLADVLGEDKDGIEAAKAILMALRAKAAKGDVRAAEVLLDRAYGKSKQTVDLNHSGGVYLIFEKAVNEDSQS
ncbi:MAG: hypothetical protein EBW56_05955 [Burkholderiaceae bacterium]|nr:hypothetical protein [Burkholderiaceae bacterium]